MAAKVASGMGGIVVTAEEFHLPNTPLAQAGFDWRNDHESQPLVGNHQQWPPIASVILSTLAKTRERLQAAREIAVPAIYADEFRPNCSSYIYV